MKTLTQMIVVAGVFVAVPQFAGCDRSHAEAHAEHEHPSHRELIEGTDIHKVSWTKKAAERTGLETGEVTQQKGSRDEEQKLAVPYSSILYTPEGKTWVYTVPQEREFVRHEIEVDYIEGQLVYLDDGPPVGTTVATVGVAEIYGSEFEVGH